MSIDLLNLKATVSNVSRQEIDLQQLKMTPMFPNVEEPQYLPETIDNGGQLAELPKLIAISSVAKETDNKGTSQPYTALSMPTFPESKEQNGKESSQVESPILNHDQRSNVKEDRVTPSQPEKPELCGCKLRILAKHSKTTWFQQYLTNLPRIDNCSRCMADQPAQGDPTTHTEPLQPPSRHKTIFINNGPIHFYDQHEKNKQSEEILMTQRQAQKDFITNVRVSADSQRSIEKYPGDAGGLLPGRKSLERGHTPKDIHHEWDEMMVKYTRESPEKKDTQTMMEQDDKYWERRKKNNASAKKSRQVRRMKVRISLDKSFEVLPFLTARFVFNCFKAYSKQIFLGT